MSGNASTSRELGLTFTGRIAGWSARHRWLTIIGAVLVLVISSLLQSTLGVKTSDVSGAGDAREGQKLLEDRFIAFEPPAELVDPGEDGDINTPEIQDAVERFIGAVGQDNAFAPPFDTQVSPAGNLFVIRVPIVDPDDEEQLQRERFGSCGIASVRKPSRTSQGLERSLPTSSAPLPPSTPEQT